MLVRDARRRHEARRAVTLLLSMDAQVLRDIGVTRADMAPRAERSRVAVGRVALGGRQPNPDDRLRPGFGWRRKG